MNDIDRSRANYYNHYVSLIYKKNEYTNLVLIYGERLNTGTYALGHKI